MNNINERLVRISAGKIFIEKALELGTDVKLLVEGTVTKIEREDNQDGTFDEIAVVKGNIVEVVANENKQPLTP